MNTTKTMNSIRRPAATAATMLMLLAVSACSSVGYRCPLDPNEKPDSATACSNMEDAMTGAKRGTGGRNSVLLDDKGRIVPREIMENRAVSPLVGNGQSNEAYYPASGQPAFQQPKQFKVWTSSYQDGNGNLHDGRTSWFTTPGRWTRGTVDRSGVVGANLLRPAAPNELPQGRIVATDRSGRPLSLATARTSPVNPEQAKKDADAAALKSLNSAASAKASPAAAKAAPVVQNQSAAGVTAPAVVLAN